MATYSLSEIDALTRKATRGAAYSWGVAEEVGKAMRWLSAYGFEGPEILAKYLEKVAYKQQEFLPSMSSKANNENVFGSKDKASCALCCGILINDLGHHLASGKTLTFNKVISPILALPFTARVAEAYKISVSFSFDQYEVICKPDGIVLKDTPLLSGTFSSTENTNIICVKVEGGSHSTYFPHSQGRVIASDALSILEKFAHKTYAPATEESRLRGAG